jgi:hypothetical protein
MRQNHTIGMRDLEFLVTFARADVERPGDRLNQRDDVATFLEREDAEPGGVQLTIGGGPIRDQLSDAALDDMRSWTTYQLLESVGNRTRPFVKSGGYATKVTSVSLSPVALKLGISPFREDSPQPQLVVKGSLIDVFRWKVLDVLRATSHERLRVCPECDKLFVRTGRSERCSRKCTNDYWNRQALSKPGAREKRRRAARAYYEARFPGNVKPGRNARRNVRKQHGKTKRTRGR